MNWRQRITSPGTYPILLNPIAFRMAKTLSEQHSECNRVKMKRSGMGHSSLHNVM